MAAMGMPDELIAAKAIPGCNCSEVSAAVQEGRRDGNWKQERRRRGIILSLLSPGGPHITTLLFQYCILYSIGSFSEMNWAKIAKTFCRKVSPYIECRKIRY
jgi:hypothetical protein